MTVFRLFLFFFIFLFFKINLKFQFLPQFFNIFFLAAKMALFSYLIFIRWFCSERISDHFI